MNSPPRTTHSPVPDEVAEELTRVVRRWRELPLDHAESFLPTVRRLVDELAGEPVPDLGPAVVMDQLRVVVYDACAAAGERRPTGIRDRLAELRRTLGG